MAGFTLLDSRMQDAIASAPYREWVLPGGERWTQFYRNDTGYLLRFPGLADFEISGTELSVACRPAPDVAEDTCEHLFLNQVHPLVLSRRGKLVFHASAVEVNGVAAAFLADSGRGKSTLAASFATGGYRFLTDDGLVLETAGGAGGDCMAMPSHPSIRLWEDSQRALVAPGAATSLPVHYTDKLRFLAGPGIAFCRQPRPLQRAYFLGDGRAAATTIEQMREPEALMAWVKNSFLLDPEPTQLAIHFGRVAELANRVSCFRLDYPRRFDGLAGVRRAIIDHLKEESIAA